MLPFSIISNTNIRPAGPTIVKVKHSYSSTVSNYILRSNGEFYVGGDNSNGQLGRGNTTALTRQMVLSRSDVRLFDHYNGTTAIVTTDNKILFCGANTVLGNNTNQAQTTWMDLSTSRFSGINIADVVKICCTNSIYILLSNGNLYSTGYGLWGQLGNGSSSNINTAAPRLVSSGVRDMEGSDAALYFVKIDGTVWGCGNNGYGRYRCIDTSEGASQANSSGYAVTTVTQMFTTASPKENTMYLFGAVNNLALMQDGTATACGNKSYGSIGLGYDTTPGSTNGVLSADAGSVTTLPVAPKLGIKFSPSALNRSYIGTDNVLYTIGYNPNGELGLGYTSPTSAPVVSWQPVSLPINPASIIGIDHGYFQTYIYTENKIYFTGLIVSCMSSQFGSSGNILTYSEINLPF